MDGKLNVDRLQLPEIETGGYLLEALFEVGPTSKSEMSEGPVSWTELLSYSDCAGTVSEPWEFKLLHKMSSAYLAAKIEGTDPLCIPPTERSEEVNDD